MITVKPEAVEILRKVQNKIRTSPTAFDMSVVMEIVLKSEKQEFLPCSVFLTDSLIPECGTTGCIAGWIIFYSYEGKRNPSQQRAPLDLAGRILGITDRRISETVFIANRWPSPFRKKDSQLQKQLFSLDSKRSFLRSSNRSTKKIDQSIVSLIKQRGELAIKRIDLLIDKGI